jgi:hypothetical protein
VYAQCARASCVAAARATAKKAFIFAQTMCAVAAGASAARPSKYARESAVLYAAAGPVQRPCLSRAGRAIIP